MINYCCLKWKEKAETADCAVSDLTKQLREKEARIGRLEKAFWELTDYAENSIDTPISAVEDAENVLNETQQQSLAHIQAEAGDQFARRFIYLVEADGELSGKDMDYLKARYVDYKFESRQQADKG